MTGPNSLVPIFAALVLTGLPAAVSPPAVELKPATAEAYQNYVQRVQAAADARANGGHFLWADGAPSRLQRLRKGEVVTERAAGDGPVHVSGGLVHDWIGAVFVPGVTLAETLALVQDYNRHKAIYPEVVDSEIKSRDGDHFVIFLRLKKKKVITVVLDTIHDAQYFRLDANRVHSRSRTTEIKQVDNAGAPDEKKLPPGTGGGFMWFLNSYWRFAARDGGVYVECQAVSLSREIPWFARALFLSGIINDLPRESLEGTLSATRAALLKSKKQPGTSVARQPVH